MRIAVWKTGHEIADTVAQSLAEGFNGETLDTRSEEDIKNFIIGGYQATLAYGVLRGTTNIFRKAESANIPWLNVDRGYFNPGHFDGYYRISYKGTQAKYDPAFPISKEFDGELEPIRKYDKSKPVLLCPPTLAVDKFFDLGYWTGPLPDNCVKREKGDPNPINWDDYRAVITFNSSVGWQAIQHGLPCLSDPLHSVVGSYYKTNSLDELLEKFNNTPRKPLFDFMRNHQFTLAEIAQGNAWPLIRHYTSSSALTAEKQSPQMSLHTASAAGLQSRFQSIT